MAPNCGSQCVPINTSSSARACCCTRQPSNVAPGTLFTACCRARKWLRTAWASVTFSTTPPTSLLCEICAETSFITTGQPMAAAACTASSSLRANSPRVTGMPAAASRRLASNSLTRPGWNPFTMVLIAACALESGASASLSYRSQASRLRR